MKTKTFRQIFSLIIIISTLSILMGCNQSEKKQKAKSLSTTNLKRVEHKYVCMTQDTIFTRELIPVKIDGKTYYGCCQGCASALKTEPEKYTLAKDPISGKQVNKADAIILGFKNKALYFESEENARKFTLKQGL